MKTSMQASHPTPADPLPGAIDPTSGDDAIDEALEGGAESDDDEAEADDDDEFFDVPGDGRFDYGDEFPNRD